MFAKLGTIMLAMGAILFVSALVLEHPPVYLGGAVQFPGQAVAMAKRTCGANNPQMLNDTSMPWDAWLNYDDRTSAYVWAASYFLPHESLCMIVIDARTGRVLDMRQGAF